MLQLIRYATPRIVHIVLATVNYNIDLHTYTQLNNYQLLFTQYTNPK